MSLIAKKSGDFVLPPDGVRDSVCVDVTPLATYPSKYGPKRKFRLVFELSDKMDDGRPFLVSQFFTPSLHKKASLRKVLESWRKKAFTEDELKGFDVEKVLGASAQLVITYDHAEGETYANVTAVLPCRTKVTPTGKYVRVINRPDYKPEPTIADAEGGSQGPNDPGDGPGAGESDDIPF